MRYTILGFTAVALLVGCRAGPPMVGETTQGVLLLPSSTAPPAASPVATVGDPFPAHESPPGEAADGQHGRVEELADAPTAAIVVAPTVVGTVAPPSLSPPPTTTFTANSTTVRMALEASPWPSSLYSTVECLVQRESRGQANAISPTNDYGLMQLNVIHASRAAALGYTWPRMLEPVANLTVAWDLYEDAGLDPWGGACL